MEKINEAWKAASEEMYKVQQDTQANSGPTADAGSASHSDGAASEGDDVQDVSKLNTYCYFCFYTFSFFCCL
ncbi:MAG: hypothetical protein CR985_02550 [Flavobacteriales bacterium]|nr:MAG: hypothetical protein CR985_02550 [Flavobacteriales bacterium]